MLSGTLNALYMRRHIAKLFIIGMMDTSIKSKAQAQNQSFQDTKSKYIIHRQTKMIHKLTNKSQQEPKVKKKLTETS